MTDHYRPTLFGKILYQACLTLFLVSCSGTPRNEQSSSPGAIIESSSKSSSSGTQVSSAATISSLQSSSSIMRSSSSYRTANASSSATSYPPLSAGMWGDLNKTYKQTSGKINVSYFVEWGIYGRMYDIADVPASNITHLLYGFLAICGNNPQAGVAASAIAKECSGKQAYEVTIVDRFAALQKTYAGDTYIEDVSGQNYNGNFGQMKRLKTRYPHLTILPSIGGWTLSSPFYSMARSDTNRRIFVESVIAFLRKYEFFDGVDIDWEYPVIAGADSGAGKPEDRDAYTALMRELRTAFDALSKETGRTYQLTSAIGASPDRVKAVDYAEASKYMDYIFMMTYDFAGTWENITGHHTPLYGNNEYHKGFNIDNSVQLMLAQGVQPNKVALGVAFYGRAWTGILNPQSSTHAPNLFPLYGRASGAGRGTWEAGVYDYKDLYLNFIGPDNIGINGFTVNYDEIAQAPYLWNASTGEFVTYDSPRSIKEKMEYILKHNLAGALSWEIDADNGLLLNAINEGLGNEEVK